MREPHDLETLAADFGGLSRPQQQEILNALKNFERVQFSALLETTANQEAAADRSDDLSHFSPWLRELIHALEPSDEERSAVTPKTRALVIELASTAWGGGGVAAGTRIEPSRSLVDTMTDLIIGRRGR